MKSKIKTIFFDLDGTLRFNNPNGREFFIEHAEKFGPKLSHEERVRVWHWENKYWAESEDLLNDHKQFGESESFWLNYSRRQLGAMNYPATLVESLTESMHVHMHTVYKPENIIMPNTHENLSALRDAGYALGVLSNRHEPFEDELRELGIADYFNWMIPAGGMGVRKPNAGAFLMALRLAGFAPHEAVYVGDNYFADVVGARNAEVAPVLFDPHRHFEAPDCPVIASLDDLHTLMSAF